MTGLPTTIDGTGGLDSYICELAEGGIKKYSSPELRSLRKWEVLILWAEEYKTIPVFDDPCGLCFPRKTVDFHLDCSGKMTKQDRCPLHHKVKNKNRWRNCTETEFWQDMVYAEGENDCSLWLSAAKKFYEWIKERLGVKND